MQRVATAFAVSAVLVAHCDAFAPSLNLRQVPGLRNAAASLQAQPSSVRNRQADAGATRERKTQGVRGASMQFGGGASGLMTSATIAAAAVNAAVSMKKLEAPDGGAKTYIVKDAARQGQVDEEGLPVVYDKDLIEAYWKKEDGALQAR